MHAIDIEGVRVLFPYEPYDIQLEYMKNVIKCLQQRTNGLLESPTGTGKTLCILCATLGWLDSQKMANLNKLISQSKSEDSWDMKPIQVSTNGRDFGYSLPQILYSSRTHSQLSQACKELKTTVYTSFKSVVIGSREQLCLNSDVIKLDSISSKNQMCKSKLANRSCPYYNGYENKVDRNDDYTSNNVFDIEDLVQFGRKNMCCPYYASRQILKTASLVFSPYNYILDPQIRRSNSLDMKNAVVIFDEGHNIEKMCEESVSTSLRSDTFAISIKFIDSVLQTLKDIDSGSYQGFDVKEYADLKIEDVARGKLMICDLESAIDSMIKSSNEMKKLHPTKNIFDIMERIGFEFTSCQILLNVLDRVSTLLNNIKTLNATETAITSASLNSLAEFIERLIPIHGITKPGFEAYKQDVIKKFKIFSERGSDDDNQSQGFWNKKHNPDAWILYFWCMSPSIGTKALIDTGIHSMIITSGTLAPIDSFDIEMGTQFPIRLQNSHIIKGNQLAIYNMSNSRDGTVLTSKYDNRENMQYYRALGQTLIEVLSVLPKGVLVFFSSYTTLNKSITIWKSKDFNIWDQMNSVKQIFLEPRAKSCFNDCVLKYKAKNDEIGSKGAAFFAVCRGKLSEGIDLPDDYCRCVIMTGLPFPPVAEPRVVLKKQYLNEAKTKLTANDWYTLQMKRTLNQSIGRVVRHKDDYGIILLMDSRFALMKDGLSKWVEKYIQRNRGKRFDDYLNELRTFFKTNSGNQPKSQKALLPPKPEPVISKTSDYYKPSIHNQTKQSKDSQLKRIENSRNGLIGSFANVSKTKKLKTIGLPNESTMISQWINKSPKNCEINKNTKSVFDYIELV